MKVADARNPGGEGQCSCRAEQRNLEPARKFNARFGSAYDLELGVGPFLGAIHERHLTTTGQPGKPLSRPPGPA